jgi:uncharacterized Zn-binding protein involved in type VI secretion
MTRGIARFSDRTFGTCSHPSHNKPIEIAGTIITGSPSVIVDKMASARIGDMVITDCGHIDQIISGSASVLAGNIGVARVGDKTGGRGIYNAVIITGSPASFTS